MSYYVKVFEEEHGECVELPLENDVTLLLSTVVAQFPGCCGLKYRFPETGAMRGVALDNGKFVSPLEGWKYDFICTFPKENKRKMEDHPDTSVTTKRRMENTCVDLIVLGLPWKLTDEDLREHFEQFGELLMAQVKKDMKTGSSKGFGFIRYASYESQKKVLAQQHVIDRRICQVKIPNSKGGPPPNSNRVFIGRCTEAMTAEDLRDYFSAFGEVLEVYIPKPFRAFAFVTFADTEVAQRLCGEDHIVSGNSIYVSTAVPRSNNKQQGGNSVAPWANQGPSGNNFGSGPFGGNNSGPGPSGGNWGGNSGGGNPGGNNGNMMNPANLNAMAMPLMAALMSQFSGNMGGWGGNNQGGNQGGNWGNNQGGNSGNDRYNTRQQ